MIRRIHLSGHHKEALRTSLWLVPAIEVLVALGLFAASNVAEVYDQRNQASRRLSR